MRLTLFEPDIPQNAGAIMRLTACFAVGLDIIEPCGFVLDDRRLRRSGMDYLASVDLVRYRSWEAFVQTRSPGRLVLLTTRAHVPFTRFVFAPDDRIVLGRESAGVPDAVHESVGARIVIPIVAPARSLNVAVSAALVLGEALRQTAGYPDLTP